MKTLIVYASTYGFAEKCAMDLSKKLNGEVELVNLGKKQIKSVANYDQVIVGGSIYMGQIQKKVKVFCANHQQELLTKKIGLFICCAAYEEAEKQMKLAIPEGIYQKAIARKCFGGIMDIEKMNFFHKTVMKMVAKSTKDNPPVVTHLEAIDELAEAMNG